MQLGMIVLEGRAQHGAATSERRPPVRHLRHVSQAVNELVAEKAASASSLSDLAKKPVIIFIDEIETIGRALSVTLSTPESDRYGYDANYLPEICAAAGIPHPQVTPSPAPVPA